MSFRDPLDRPLPPDHVIEGVPGAGWVAALYVAAAAWMIGGLL